MSDTLLEDLNNKKKELITHYKRKQDNHNKQLEQLRSELGEIHQTILNECQELQETSEKLKEKAKLFISDCTESLSQKNKGIVIIDIKDLANYLKVEKEVLKKLSDQSQPKTPNELDIHDLLKKSKLEKTLRQMKKKQLEDEIKYLENNVLSKGMLIYNPATSSLFSTSEEKTLNQKLQQSIKELERVISLSLPCNMPSDQSSKLYELENQKKRLKECESILMSQSQKLTNFTKYFQNQVMDISNKLPFPIVTVKKDYKFDLQKEQEEVPMSQLDEILGFDIPLEPIVGKLSHKFDDWQEKIEVLRKKVKKIEKML